MLLTDDSLRPYFEDVLGETTDKARFIGRVEDGKILGVAAIYNYDGHCCEAGWTGERGWMTRGFLMLLFDYIFNQLNCKRCSVLIQDDNPTAIKLAEKIGFIREGCMRQGWEGGDLFLYGLLKKDFRYGKG